MLSKSFVVLPGISGGAGWSGLVVLTALVTGCGTSNDGAQQQGASPGGYAGYGGYGGQGGFAAQGGLPPSNGGVPQQIPPPGPLCGNGIVDQGEQCEGTTTQTCQSATFGARPTGTVACTNCYIDTSNCSAVFIPPGGGAPNGGAPNGGAPQGGAPQGGVPQGGAGGGISPPPAGDPMIPQVTASCPNFANGAWNFMGKSGQMSVGTPPGGPTAPMVFYFHGTGSNASEYNAMAGPIRDGVVQEGGVLVSFTGMGSGGSIPLSGTAIFDATYFDVADQFLACAVRDRKVDPHRVFTTGCSAGGLMATSMAVERSGYVAASAPNSGGMISLDLPFQGSHTPSLMTVHGANDMVIVNFVTTSSDADKVFKQRGASIVIDCNTGGGHCGGAGLSGDAWKFFEAHPFGVTPEPWASGLPAGFSSQCQIQ